jgi:hypothetical protein
MPTSDPAPSGNSPPDRSAAASFLRVLGAVFASFLGIRKQASGEHDMESIKPQHIIVAGVLGAALFVTLLVLLVKYITRGI